MGEYADDLIEGGLMSESPFGRRSIGRRVRKPSSPLKLKIEVPKVSNDDFEQWFQELAESAGAESMSSYEYALLGWLEAVKRMNR